MDPQSCGAKTGCNQIAYQRLVRPQKVDCCPEASRWRFTNAVNEETQLPMKCHDIPSTARST